MNKSFKYYLFLLIAYLIGTIVGTVAVLYALYTYVPNMPEIPSAVVTVIVLMMPALMVAQSFWKNEQRKMTRGEGWGLATGGAVVNTAVFLGTLYAIKTMSAHNQMVQQVFEDLWSNKLAMLTLTLTIFVIAALVIRLFLYSGIRGQIKAQERIERRKAKR